MGRHGAVFGAQSLLCACWRLSPHPVLPSSRGSDYRRVSKIEYDSAKSYYLLRTKLGAYVRTGHGAIIDVAARSAAATLAINERQRKSPA